MTFASHRFWNLPDLTSVVAEHCDHATLLSLRRVNSLACIGAHIEWRKACNSLKFSLHPAPLALWARMSLPDSLMLVVQKIVVVLPNDRCFLQSEASWDDLQEILCKFKHCTNIYIEHPSIDDLAFRITHQNRALSVECLRVNSLLRSLTVGFDPSELSDDRLTRASSWSIHLPESPAWRIAGNLAEIILGRIPGSKTRYEFMKIAQAFQFVTNLRCISMNWPGNLDSLEFGSCGRMNSRHVAMCIEGDRSDALSALLLSRDYTYLEEFLLYLAETGSNSISVLRTLLAHLLVQAKNLTILSVEINSTVPNRDLNFDWMLYGKGRGVCREVALVELDKALHSLIESFHIAGSCENAKGVNGCEDEE